MRNEYWMQTHSGGKFYFDDPENSDIRIEDIAHSLSNICRFGGHTKVFYSVADHSVYVSHLVDQRYALEGLLHDAHEAYIGDAPSPLKWFLGDKYATLDKRLKLTVADHYGLNTVESKGEVHEADMKALFAEKKWLLAEDVDWGWEKAMASVYPTVRSPWAAEGAFLERFHELNNKRTRSWTGQTRAA
jgi:hypothetical protein